MGCCFGDAYTKELNQRMRDEKNQDEDVIKLLFLGAGGSGKSTLFKQLRLIHGNGLQDNERLGYKDNIYQNLVDGMKALLEGNSILAMDEEPASGTTQNMELKTQIAACEENLAEYIEKLDDAAPITKATAECFKKAWSDPGMRETWNRRAVLQLQDSLKYFIESIDRIATEDYVPSVDDVMRVRIQTTGIIEETLTMNERIFHIVDVGGQRSERRKWINCFSGVTGLIFVASLTAYNQFLYEDEKVNRLIESLQLFKKLLSGETFKNACVVLFLNKADLFSEMVVNTPITTCLPEYKGDLTEEAQYNYIKWLYESQTGSKSIYTHKTCATETDQIEVIFRSVNHNIINKVLIDAGLIVVM